MILSSDDKKLIKELNEKFQSWLKQTHPEFLRLDYVIVKRHRKEELPSDIAEMINVSKKKEAEREKNRDKRIKEAQDKKEKLDKLTEAEKKKNLEEAEKKVLEQGF